MIKIRFTDTDAGNENEFEGKMGMAVIIGENDEGKTYDVVMISGDATTDEIGKSLADLTHALVVNGFPKEIAIAAATAGVLREDKETET